jgi:tetratricopeptide (TPR) repeat protein
MQRTVLALYLMIAFANSSVNVIVFAEAPAQTIQSLLAEARDAQSRRDFHAAAESYRKAAELEPSVPELWTNLGLMYHEAGKREDAIRSFREATRLNASLFVPQLFLGIEYLGSNNPEAALPFLEKAEKLSPDDVQAALNLGKAYTLLNRPDHAADTYFRATRIAPNEGDVWLSLGMAYLQQVEFDARLMTSAYTHSTYMALRAAETLAEEGKLIQAETAYKAALANNSPARCAHAQFGITLLRMKRIVEANKQFELETRSESHCGLTKLGLAVAQLAEGHPDVALAALTSISMADPEFVESSLPLFRDAISAEQARPLIDLSRTQQNHDRASVEIGSLIAIMFVADAAPAPVEFSDAPLPLSKRKPVAADAERLFATGQYSLCSDALKSTPGAIDSTQLQLLASCSFYAGDFRTTSFAAQRLRTSTVTRAQGLYWESKADQKLAVAALTRAGELDADSPRMHVLLGDTFRQVRNWGDAESEYRKAVALDPKSHSARLSLAIDLFTELKTDEAFEIDHSLLAEDANDPEGNLLAGEILVQRNFYAEAEQYLSKCRNLKPEFVPRLHVLLGQVYAETDRIPAAISEYKAGLSTDEDGSVHYQLARVYQKSGYKDAAAEAFKDSQRMRRQSDERAHIVLEQNSADLSHQ